MKLTAPQEDALYKIYNTKHAAKVHFSVIRNLRYMGLIHLVCIDRVNNTYQYRVTDLGAKLLHFITEN